MLKRILWICCIVLSIRAMEPKHLKNNKQLNQFEQITIDYPPQSMSMSTQFVSSVKSENELNSDQMTKTEACVYAAGLGCCCLSISMIPVSIFCLSYPASYWVAISAAFGMAHVYCIPLEAACITGKSVFPSHHSAKQ